MKLEVLARTIYEEKKERGEIANAMKTTTFLASLFEGRELTEWAEFFVKGNVRIQ